MVTMVYIDNDNLQFTKYESILKSLLNESFLKIFINRYDLSKIDDSSIDKHKFIINNNNGKNSSDIALTIECMKDLLNNKIGTFIIVSNDSDFIPLCKEIKEYGKKCYLYVDKDPNKNILEIYDKVVNIGNIYREKEDKKLKIIELKRQKELEEKRRMQNIQNIQNIQNKDMISKIKNLLDPHFKIEHIQKNGLIFDKIVTILNSTKINYKLHGTLGNFLKMYLPKGYEINGNVIEKVLLI